MPRVASKSSLKIGVVRALVHDASAEVCTLVDKQGIVVLRADRGGTAVPCLSMRRRPPRLPLNSLALVRHLRLLGFLTTCRACSPSPVWHDARPPHHPTVTSYTRPGRVVRGSETFSRCAPPPPPHRPPPATAGMDRWRLAATEQLVASTKSIVLAAALTHGRVPVPEALAAARLEEDFQAEDWGRVEAGHDLDEADTATRVAAPVVFLRLLRVGAERAERTEEAAGEAAGEAAAGAGSAGAGAEGSRSS